jgi:tRNA threonylcarbamoyladenosine biosynthesis protein TsaE
MIHISKSLEDTKEIAEAFVRRLETGENATVVALHGDLGAGKTAFSQAVGSILGVTETMQSPTFVIEKIYPIDYRGFKHLIHIDAYRLEKESEMLHLGWEEISKEKENLILVEWPEKIEGIMPENAKKIFFRFIDEQTRDIQSDEI